MWSKPLSENHRGQQPGLSAARLALSPGVVLGSLAASLFVPAGRCDLGWEAFGGPMTQTPDPAERHNMAARC